MKKIYITAAIVVFSLFALYQYYRPNIITKDGHFKPSYNGHETYQLLSGEVPAVTAYLKEHLNDWKSYEPISWTPLIDIGMDQYNSKRYQVKHTFRAANGFGGVRLETLTFELSDIGTVWRAETAEEIQKRLSEAESKKKQDFIESLRKKK